MRAPALLCALALSLLLAPTAGRAAPATPAPPLDDALVAPPRSALSSAAGDLRGPSQFMAGRVAVRLVLPESDGGAEPSSEHWAAEEIAQVGAQVRLALNWWEARLPLAGLSFSLRVDVAPTGYEPIRHRLADEGLWIGDSLRRMGFDGPSYFDQVYAAGDAHRAEAGADWTTTIFIADSSAHPTGYFADGRFAYAYINGPFMVITADAGGYGAARLAPVVAHELGHIFGALDQYPAARITCERRSGYLDAPTSNSQYGGCGGREPSIMLEPMSAFSAGQIDASARAQVGYQDGDGDGLIDPLDTAPAVELAEARLASRSGRPLLSGETRDIPFPAPSQQRVTLNSIAGVEYRVDGGPWIPVPAADGAYNGPAESFAAELPLYDGDYLVEVRARNSAGVASTPAPMKLTVSWLGPAPAYRPVAPPLVAGPELGLSLEAPASTMAVQVAELPGFAGAPWQPYTPRLTYRLSGADGRRTVYVRFKDWAGLESLPFALSVTLDTAPPVGWAAHDARSPGTLMLDARDATSGVEAVEVQVGDGPPGWRPYAGSLALGPGGAGAQVTLRFRDAAGNVSAPYTVAPGYRVALPLVAL